LVMILVSKPLSVSVSVAKCKLPVSGLVSVSISGVVLFSERHL
jgi:hypothetical protein